MIKEALMYNKLANDNVQCKLCAHRCIISNNKRGFCKVRENKNGTLYTLNYGMISSQAIDPIEKKPLYHFYPGTQAYSIGTIGCNFRCKHCQNWSISQQEISNVRTIDLSPLDVIKNVLNANAKTIAWTYNEPTIWYEYTLDCAKLAKEEGIATAYVTNGYITPEALKNIAPYLDAFRVDIKSFNNDFYKDIASAKLQPVLDATKCAHNLGLHVEIINLIIPGKNDDIEDISLMIQWILDNLGPDTPVHFTRFYPQYKIKNLTPTPIEKLEHAHEVARRSGLNYVYIGNIPGNTAENTYCPKCNNSIIQRGPFSDLKCNITSDKKCTYCGNEISIII